MSIADQLAARGLPELPEPLPVPVVDSHPPLDSTAEVAGLPVAGPRLELWRAPTDNDRGAGFGGDGPGTPWNVLWRAAA